jgi:hypothetical protein
VPVGWSAVAGHASVSIRQMHEPRWRSAAPHHSLVTRAEVERVVEGAPNRVRRNGAPMVADVLVVTPSRVTTTFTALITAVDW